MQGEYLGTYKKLRSYRNNHLLMIDTSPKPKLKLYFNKHIEIWNSLLPTARWLGVEVF
jgi:hypothetical protein